MQQVGERCKIYFYGAHLSQAKILCWSKGWLTPDTARQTARTADRFEPDFESASAITCSKVSLAAVSVQKRNYLIILTIQ